MKTFKKSKAFGFFDEDFRLDKLTKMGDPVYSGDVDHHSGMLTTLVGGQFPSASRQAF